MNSNHLGELLGLERFFFKNGQVIISHDSSISRFVKDLVLKFDVNFSEVKFFAMYCETYSEMEISNH